MFAGAFGAEFTLRKMTDVWLIDNQELIGLLGDTSVEFASLYPFEDISEVQNFKQSGSTNYAIQQAFHKALSGSASTSDSLLQAIFNRLEADENSLNWVFHREMTTSCQLAGNDLNVIEFIKKMPAASKLSIIGMAMVGKGASINRNAYKEHLETAIIHVCEFCSKEGSEKFSLLPTDIRMLGGKSTSTGDPGYTAISYNASSLQTLPKTLLVRLVENSALYGISTSTIEMMRSFPLASGVRIEILNTLYTPVTATLPEAIQSHLITNYRNYITIDDLVSKVEPVAGGHYRHNRRGHTRFADVKLVEADGDCDYSQKFLNMIAQLFAMSDIEMPSDSSRASGLDFSDKIASFERRLASIPGLPPLNNYTRSQPGMLSFKLIDEFLDSASSSVISSCAYQGPEYEGDYQVSNNFLARLINSSPEDPKGVFYQYGLARLALEAKDHLKKSGDCSLDDLGLEAVCRSLQLMHDEQSFVFSRKDEVFSRLPERLKTLENKVMLGLGLTKIEAESSEESLVEKSLLIDLGM